MAAIQGITVILYDRVKTGTDAFNAPVYAESPTEVKNVLVCPVSTEDIITDFQLYGKRAEYELCIPKGDTHIWENRTVEFFGKKWRTFGTPGVDGTPGAAAMEQTGKGGTLWLA